MNKKNKISKQLHNILIVATITLFIFLVINIAASLYLKANPLDKSERDLFFSATEGKGLAIRKRAFNTDDESLLKAYANSPGIRPHTVLHFTEGASNAYYNVGIEGARYLSSWTDETVRKILSKPNAATFVFGGSTTFGDGVPDDSTLVASLNSIDPGNTYINFGIQAYDSLREVDKLFYLLRKGYRPKAVIFIDGLNDVTTFGRSPYEIYDTPRAQGLVLDRGQVPLIFGAPKSRNMRLAFAYSLPITHLFHRMLYKKDYDAGVLNRKSANVYGIDSWMELLDFQYNWAQIYRNDINKLSADIVRYYRQNIAFVRQLEKSFGFEAYFIYQPIGLVDKNQPFLKENYFKSDLFAVYSGVDSLIRNEIHETNLEMKDCSGSLSLPDADSVFYIDPTHYSPAGNEAFALCIHEMIATSRKRS